MSEPQPDPAQSPEKLEALRRALKQSEQVHDDVEQAAADLSTVNAVLKDELTEVAPLNKLEQVLTQSEAIEVNVINAAAELTIVNDTLAVEIDARHQLEDQLEDTTAALKVSRAAERKATHDALHDLTTGLPNLALFSDRLRNALTQAQRHGRQLAVMFIDLDRFKAINDTHGHDAGDAVLRQVARRLLGVVRGGDTACRRSGDEFLFLMIEPKDMGAVLALANRLASSLALPFEVDGAAVSVGASVGVAIFPQDGVTPEALLKSADLAMYAAKEREAGPMLFSQLPPH